MANPDHEAPAQSAAAVVPPPAAVPPILRNALGVLLLAVVAVNVVNATGRYVLGISFLGADELMVYTVIWVVMLGAVLSLLTRSHINVNLVPSYASPRTLRLLYVIHDAAAVFACSYVTYASWQFIRRISRLGVESMGLGLPMTVPHSALLFGFGGMTIAALLMLVRDLIALFRNSPNESRGP